MAKLKVNVIVVLLLIGYCYLFTRLSVLHLNLKLVSNLILYLFL